MSNDEPRSIEPDAAPEATDRSLLNRVRDGESDAFLALYLKYAERLTQLARRQTNADLGPRLDPEDIVQSVFRTFFRRASAGMYDIPEGDVLWKLLLVIALNKIRKKGNYHRAAKRDVRNTSSLGELGWEPRDRRAVSDDAVQVLEWTIREALAQLEPAQVEVITLRIEGNTVAEITERTGKARRSVERILQQFRQQLDQVIREEGGDGGR